MRDDSEPVTNIDILMEKAQGIGYWVPERTAGLIKAIDGLEQDYDDNPDESDRFEIRGRLEAAFWMLENQPSKPRMLGRLRRRVWYMNHSAGAERLAHMGYVAMLQEFTGTSL